MPDGWIRVVDLARELRCTRQTIHDRIKRRGLNAPVIGRDRWISPEQADQIRGPIQRRPCPPRNRRAKPSPPPPLQPQGLVITPATAADVVAAGVAQIVQQLQAQGLLGTANTNTELAVMATTDLVVDARRFQFRTISHHGTLRDVAAWNPDLCGTLSVWRDPADQKTYCVDGHHRHALAVRLQVPTLAVRFLTAASAADARVAGALINIGHNNATAIDAAKLIRDAGLTPAQIAEHGLPRNGRILRDGLLLAALAPELFTATATGELAEDLALAVASFGPSHTLQRDLLAQAKRHRWSVPAVQEAAEIARHATVTTSSSGLLPGLDGFAQSDLRELLAVRSEVRAQLKLEHRALGVAARKRSAAVLEAAGSLIDSEAAGDARAQVGVVRDVFSQLAGQSGVISDLLRAMAAEVGPKRSAAQVVADHLDLIRQAVATELGVS